MGQRNNDEVRHKMNKVEDYGTTTNILQNLKKGTKYTDENEKPRGEYSEQQVFKPH
jgi:hypothetical protein